MLVSTVLCCWQKEGKKGRNNNDYLLSRVTAALLKDGIVTDVIAEAVLPSLFSCPFSTKKGKIIVTFFFEGKLSMLTLRDKLIKPRMY
jgi:hypothetical protein